MEADRVKEMEFTGVAPGWRLSCARVRALCLLPGNYYIISDTGRLSPLRLKHNRERSKRHWMEKRESRNT